MQDRIQQARNAALQVRNDEAEPKIAEPLNSWTITCIALAIMFAILDLKLLICGADRCYADEQRGTMLVSEPREAAERAVLRARSESVQVLRGAYLQSPQDNGPPLRSHWIRAAN
jgi:hypothetical protein